MLITDDDCHLLLNYADILVEGVFRAIECRLVQMNVFSHYCLTFSANDCVFSVNEQKKGVFQIHMYKFNKLPKTTF